MTFFGIKWLEVIIFAVGGAMIFLIWDDNPWIGALVAGLTNVALQILFKITGIEKWLRSK